MAEHGAARFSVPTVLRHASGGLSLRWRRPAGRARRRRPRRAWGRTFSCSLVVNAAQAEAILFAGGALAALPENGVIVLMATCGAVEKIAARVLEAGRRFVDAPVSGAWRDAHHHGRRPAGHRSMPDGTRLDALGDKVFHVGEKPGQGAIVRSEVHIAVGGRARRQSWRRPGDHAQNPRRLVGLKLDAEGPRAADVRRRR